MRLGYRNYVPDREDLRAGECCDDCGTQLKAPFIQPEAPCPSCGSTRRRQPRRKGQAVGDVIDVAATGDAA